MRESKATQVRKPKKFKKLLFDAAKIIEERGWTQGALARKVDGSKVWYVSDPAASQFCILGSLFRAAGEGGYGQKSRLAASERLDGVLGWSSTDWNDDLPELTGKAKVIEVLRAAAIHTLPPKWEAEALGTVAAH